MKLLTQFYGQIEAIVGADNAFAALRRDGTVATWGDIGDTGDSSWSKDLVEVQRLVASCDAFAAIRDMARYLIRI